MKGLDLWVAPASMLSLAWRQRKVLASITRFELQKRFSGSVLGLAWIVLYPSLLLLLYLFVFLVVFRVRFPGFSSFDYVLYVFAGLVPFIGLSETVSSGCAAMRQSLYLVKNVVLPPELIPLRTVLASLAGQLVSLAILLVMVAASGRLTEAVLMLPLVVLLQLLFHAGLVCVVSVAGLLIADLAQVVALGLMMLMFLSPIAFKAEMVPAQLAAALYANPVFYLVEAYRACLLPGSGGSAPLLVAYALMCLLTFAGGATVFRRLKGALAEYE
jgi:lipopolysaccharide transport system permease protein